MTSSPPVKLAVRAICIGGLLLANLLVLFFRNEAPAARPETAKPLLQRFENIGLSGPSRQLVGEEQPPLDVTRTLLPWKMALFQRGLAPKFTDNLLTGLSVDQRANHLTSLLGLTQEESSKLTGIVDTFKTESMSLLASSSRTYVETTPGTHVYGFSILSESALALRETTRKKLEAAFPPESAKILLYGLLGSYGERAAPSSYSVTIKVKEAELQDSITISSEGHEDQHYDTDLSLTDNYWRRLVGAKNP